MNPEFREVLLKENSGWAALKSKYGLSKEQYLALLEAQNFRCKICGATGGHTMRKTGKSTAPQVDHCHRTGRVRGLLCGPCNRILGFADDNPTILLKAIQYLKGNL